MSFAEYCVRRKNPNPSYLTLRSSATDILSLIYSCRQRQWQFVSPLKSSRTFDSFFFYFVIFPHFFYILSFPRLCDYWLTTDKRKKITICYTCPHVVVFFTENWKSVLFTVFVLFFNLYGKYNKFLLFYFITISFFLNSNCIIR